MTEVARLLTASRDAHAAYRHLHEDAAKVKAKKPDGWQGHLWDAFSLRNQAHALDPQHTDAAWLDDQAHANHATLLTFYAQQLGLENLENGEGAARR